MSLLNAASTSDEPEDYRIAFERQKMARLRAEELLENRSRELYEMSQSLANAYHQLKDQNAQILHQEKLASIGQLSAGVAHEINNPTAFVKSNIHSLARYTQELRLVFEGLDLALRDLASGEKSREDVLAEIEGVKKRHDLEYILNDLGSLVDETLIGVERIQDIVKSLKDFSRPDQNEPVSFDLHQCIDNTIKLLWNEIKYNVTIEKHYCDLPTIKGQPGSLGQVFLNIIVNASHAMEKPGTVVITTEKTNTHVIIYIQDNGRGIPAAVISRIFDPFFTTKGVGKGTGLGLSISHGIVAKHCGTLSVESQEGVGTTFIIKLPLDLDNCPMCVG